MINSDNRKLKSPIQHEYDGMAKEYDKRWQKYISKSASETLKRINLAGANEILDVGCGTGELLYVIHQQNPDIQLKGIDISPEMLKVAESKLGSAAELQVGAASALPFDTNSIDMVMTISSFHYWPEPESCLTELRRVLKPGGRLIITDWCDDYLICKICDIFLRIFNNAHYKTYSLSDCKSLLRNSGFLDIQSEKYKIDFIWGLMTISACKSYE